MGFLGQTSLGRISTISVGVSVMRYADKSDVSATEGTGIIDSTGVAPLEPEKA
jgi:hypothetical protein